MEIINEILSVLRYLPLVIPRWVWVLLGILIAVTIIYKLFTRFWPTKRPVLKPPPTRPAKTSQVPKKQTTASLDTQPIVQPLKIFFRKLLKQLRTQVAGRDYLYQVPWVMMIGETGVGKTTLLSQTQLNLPLGMPTTSELGCDAWLFDKGIIFDVSSKYVLHLDQINATERSTVITSEKPLPLSDEKGWRTLLKMLRHYRPRRPLDGIILTIPCGDLLDKSPDNLIKKADYLYQKLWQAQKELGLRLPIYILITQTDKLKGFTSFCAVLPEQLRHNILGWSNPYSLETVHKSTLLDEAFQKIYQEINDLQLELVTVFNDIPNRDEFLLFPHQFRKVFRQLKFYMDTLFKSSVYHESFFLRGIYFCGNAMADQLVLSQSELESSDQLAFEPQLEEKPQEQQILFLHHLFRDKIFPESAVAFPVSKILRWQQRKLLGLQIFIVVTAIVWILGQRWAYQQLTLEKETLVPVLEEIQKNLTNLDSVRLHIKDPLELNELKTNSADRLIKGMAEMNSDNFSSLFLPTSKFSEVNDQIIHTLVLGYDAFIINSFYHGLKDKTKSIINPSDIFFSSGNHSLVSHPELTQIKQMMADLKLLQKQVDNYNNLQKSDIKHLGQLTNYLFGIQLSGDYYSYAHLVQEALTQTQEPKFNLNDYTQDAHTKISRLVNQWLDKSLAKNNLLKEVQSLTLTLQNLENERAPDELDKQIKGLQTSILSLEQYLEKLEWNWLTNSKLMPPTVENMFLTMATTPLLGPILSDELKQSTEKRLNQFRLKLRTFKSRLTGPILIKTETVPKKINPSLVPKLATITPIPLGISPKLLELKTILEQFVALDFMAKTNSRQLRTIIPSHKQLVWQTQPLEKALSLAKSYQQYMEDKVAKMNPYLQPILRDIGGRYLYDNMVNLVAKAQRIEYQLSGVGGLEETLPTQVQNFSTATPLLEQNISVFKDLKNPAAASVIQTIRKLGISQAKKLLIQVDSLLMQDSLYTPFDDTFANWDNKKPLLQAAFALNDQDEAKYYLELQRNRVQFLANTYAKPLLNFLGNKQIYTGQRLGVVYKWQRILASLVKYEQKKTTNSVTSLETFILLELDKVNLTNCFDKTYTKKVRTGSDYFLQKRASLQRLLASQCQYLADIQIYQNYSVIQDFFNQNLAGRFPFAILTSESFFEEAEPETIQYFFGIYEMYGGQKLIDALLNSQTYVGSQDKIINFLYNIQKVKIFLETLIKETIPLQKPLYEFVVDFRVNQKHEIGANQIINLGVEMSGQQNSTTIEKGLWKWGDALQVSLRWARNSPFRPYWDGITSKPVMTLAGNDDIAIFEYKSKWALLEMIQRQRAAANDFTKLVDLQPHSLKFVIPVKQLLASNRFPNVDNDSISSQSTTSTKTNPPADGKQIRSYLDPSHPFSETVVVQATPDLSENYSKPAAATIPYQEKYRELFEDTSQAIVFIRFTLTFPNKKERLVVPKFPVFAPTLAQ